MLYFVTFSKHVKLSLFNLFELPFFQNVSGKSYSYVEKRSFDKLFEDFKLKDTPSWNQTNWKLLFEKWDYCVIRFFFKTLLKVTQTLLSILSFFLGQSDWLLWIIFSPEISSFIFSTLFSDAFAVWNSCNVSPFDVWALREHVRKKLKHDKHASVRKVSQSASRPLTRDYAQKYKIFQVSPFIQGKRKSHLRVKK